MMATLAGNDRSVPPDEPCTYRYGLKKKLYMKLVENSHNSSKNIVLEHKNEFRNFAAPFLQENDELWESKGVLTEVVVGRGG